MMKLNMCSSQDTDESTKSDTDSINLRLKMNVNEKNSNMSISQKKYNLIMTFIIFNILFCIMLFGKLQFLNGQAQTLVAMEKEIKALQTLKMQVRALQVQVNYLTSKSQDDSQIINRDRRSIDHSDSSSLVKPPIHELSNPLEDKNNSDSNIALLTSNNETISLVSRRLIDYYEDDKLEKNGSDIRIPLIRSKNNSIVDSNATQDLLYNKTIFKSQNYTTMKDEENDNIKFEMELQTSRTQRSNKRYEKRRNKIKGERRRQNRRRPKCNYERLSPLVATFIGANPQQRTMNTGPWIKNDNTNNIQYDFTKFYLVENNVSIEVSISGLYMISVQIYYSGESINHSYWLLLKAEGASASRKLVTCATAFSNMETSCYTNIITYLAKGDRLYVQQQETDRLIDMREGYSYLQFVLLETNMRRRLRSEEY